MIEWRTDKPQGNIIVAKLSEAFTYDSKNVYEVLHFYEKPYEHYSNDWGEVPYSAIEKWALIEEEKKNDK